MQHLADQLKSPLDHIKQIYQQQLFVRGEDQETLHNKKKLGNYSPHLLVKK
jgi:hypothetical protein